METEQDRPDFASEIAVLLNEAKDTEEENIFTIGDGAALGRHQPFGHGRVHGTDRRLLDPDSTRPAPPSPKTDYKLPRRPSRSATG